MKTLIFTLLLTPALSWSNCDLAKIYKSDEILFQTECNSSKLKACMIKAFTEKGREYIGVKVMKGSTKVVQVYNWLDVPNSENATFWEASRLIRMTNLSSQFPGRVTKAEYWKVDNILQVSVSNFVENKLLLSTQLKCK